METLVHLMASIAKLKDCSTAAGELVSTMDNMHGHYGMPAHASSSRLNRSPLSQQQAGFTAAGGIAALVHVAVTGWPADGNLAASQHPYDSVVDVSDSAVQHEYDPLAAETGAKLPGPKWRSPRRKAIVCLTNMAQSEAYFEEMEAAGLLQALPAMLESSFEHVDYSLHNNGWAYLHVQDQTQTVVVQLLHLAALAVQHSSSFQEQCRQHTAMAVCRQYQDQLSIMVDKHFTERQALRAACLGKCWSAERVEAEVALMRQQHHMVLMHEQQRQVGLEKHYFEQGGLDHTFCLFVNHLLKICNRPQQWALIHKAGLITKLKGCSCGVIASRRSDSPITAIAALTKCCTEVAAGVSKEWYKTIQGDEAQSRSLRQTGDELVAAGELRQALKVYWDAVKPNPQDPILYNNISTMELKLGNHKQALEAAEEAVKLGPTLPASWGRLGDALMAINRGQLAHLAYTCGRELALDDAELQVAQAQARSHLAEVWDTDDVPDLLTSAGATANRAAAQWLGLTTAGDLEQLLSTDTELRKIPAARFACHSRYYALVRLKPLVKDARSLAVASGAVSVSALPASCAGLKRTDQLPQLEETWQLDVTDTPMRHMKHEQIRHLVTITCSNTGVRRAALVTLGLPGLQTARRLLLTAIVNPNSGAPGHPKRLDVRHKLSALIYGVIETCKDWGIEVTAESESEARLWAKQYDVDWEGVNYLGQHADEDKDHVLFRELSWHEFDWNSGHKILTVPKVDSSEWRSVTVGAALVLVAAAVTWAWG